MQLGKNYFIVFDTIEGAYLCLHSDKGLLTYPTQGEARDAFELGYQEAHGRTSPTWSTSAMLNWMNLRPFVVALDKNLAPLEVLKVLSVSEDPDLKVYSLSSNVVRHVKGAKVNLEDCRKYEVASIELIDTTWCEKRGIPKVKTT